MDNDVRTNPALLKLDLYCKGMRMDDSCFIERDGGRSIMRTRAGLGSGLELVLPGGLWTNVPVTEAFALESPYELRKKESRYTIWRGTEAIADVTLSPRPAWYDLRTSSGKPMTRIGSLQGTYLGIYPAKVCEYWLERPERDNCKFCSVGLNLGVDDADTKSVDEVLEVVHAAMRESAITYVDFNTGHYEGDTYLDILQPYIERVKKETGLLIGVQTPPHNDLKRYDHLKRIGVNRVSFCFEIFDRQRFIEVCPGKHRQYGLPGISRRCEYCAKLGGGLTGEPWVSNGEIVAGLEPRVLHGRHRLGHERGRHPHRLRVPAAQGDRLRGCASSPHRGSDPGVPASVRVVHGARPADRRGAEHPRQSRAASRGVPLVLRPEILGAGAQAQGDVLVPSTEAVGPGRGRAARSRLSLAAGRAA